MHYERLINKTYTSIKDSHLLAKCTLAQEGSTSSCKFSVRMLDNKQVNLGHVLLAILYM